MRKEIITSLIVAFSDRAGRNETTNPRNGKGIDFLSYPIIKFSIRLEKPLPFPTLDDFHDLVGRICRYIPTYLPTYLPTYTQLRTHSQLHTPSTLHLHLHLHRNHTLQSPTLPTPNTTTHMIQSNLMPSDDNTPSLCIH